MRRCRLAETREWAGAAFQKLKSVQKQQGNSGWPQSTERLREGLGKGRSDSGRRTLPLGSGRSLQEEGQAASEDR